jgi:hypothetical protein
MNLVVRTIAAAVTAIGSFYFTFWTGGALLFFVDVTEWASVVLATVVAAGAARFVWSRAGVRGGLVSSVCTGAIVTGTIAFSAGFFGPILLMPGANQGPLLGIFFTGPLGFLLGGIGGAAHWAIRRGRPRS